MSQSAIVVAPQGILALPASNFEKLVLFGLWSYADSATGLCWPSRPTLAQRLGIDPSRGNLNRISRVTSKLETLGLLARTWIKRGSRRIRAYRLIAPGASVTDAGGAHSMGAPNELQKRTAQELQPPLPAAADPVPAAVTNEPVSGGGDFQSEKSANLDAAVPAAIQGATPPDVSDQVLDDDQVPHQAPATRPHIIDRILAKLPDSEARQTVHDEWQGQVKARGSQIRSPIGLLRHLVNACLAGTMTTDHADRINRERDQALAREEAERLAAETRRREVETEAAQAQALDAAIKALVPERLEELRQEHLAQKRRENSMIWKLHAASGHTSAGAVALWRGWLLDRLGIRSPEAEPTEGR